MLSKPSVVVIPAFAFLIYLLYFKEKFWQSFKKLIPFIVVTIPFIIMLRFVQPASYHTEVAPLWSRFFIWMDTINFYFLKTLIPYPLVVTYTRTFQTLLPKYWFYLEWIIPVLLVFFAVKLYKRNPIILLGLLLFIVGFLPVSGLVSFVFQKWSNVADRYVYFSMFGLGLVIAWLLAKYHNKLVWILLLDILLCFTLLTILIQIPVWKNSLTLWNHALIHGRPSTYAYNNRGIALQNNGEYEMALEDYKKSIILNSLHTKSYYNIGIVYSKNERPDSAITYYNKAIAQRKDYIDAYLNRGVAYVSLEEYDKAISDYNFVINLRSDDEMAYSNRGIAYSELGRYNEAISDFSRAIELNPQRAQTYYLRGKVNFFERNYTAALEDYNKALLLDDTFVDAYIKRALLYAEMGNFEQAINDINKASSLTQNDIEILITKGDIFSKEKYFSESAQAYTDAINIEPDCGILYQKRAVSYYFLGKYENARKDIQKAENLGIIIPKSFLNALEKK